MLKVPKKVTLLNELNACLPLPLPPLPPDIITNK